jgi:hypothetical protein
MEKEQLLEKIGLLADQQGNQSGTALGELLKDVLDYIDGIAEPAKCDMTSFSDRAAYAHSSTSENYYRKSGLSFPVTGNPEASLLEVKLSVSTVGNISGMAGLDFGNSNSQNDRTIVAQKVADGKYVAIVPPGANAFPDSSKRSMALFMFRIIGGVLDQMYVKPISGYLGDSI